MTSNRPYRAARTMEAVRKEIELWSGRQFDPQIVRVFLAMPDDIWEDLRKDIHEQIYGFQQHIALRASR
jgi:HD-GYP domain-containing protein (c-di-GMP phosphodiesterase class II)